jgi:hypothetical protein
LRLKVGFSIRQGSNSGFQRKQETSFNCHFHCRPLAEQSPFAFERNKPLYDSTTVPYKNIYKVTYSLLRMEKPSTSVVGKQGVNSDMVVQSKRVCQYGLNVNLDKTESVSFASNSR